MSSKTFLCILRLCNYCCILLSYQPWLSANLSTIEWDKTLIRPSGDELHVSFLYTPFLQVYVQFDLEDGAWILCLWTNVFILKCDDSWSTPFGDTMLVSFLHTPFTQVLLNFDELEDAEWIPWPWRMFLTVPSYKFGMIPSGKELHVSFLQTLFVQVYVQFDDLKDNKEMPFLLATSLEEAWLRSLSDVLNPLLFPTKSCITCVGLFPWDES